MIEFKTSLALMTLMFVCGIVFGLLALQSEPDIPARTATKVAHPETADSLDDANASIGLLVDSLDAANYRTIELRKELAITSQELKSRNEFHKDCIDNHRSDLEFARTELTEAKAALAKVKADLAEKKQALEDMRYLSKLAGMEISYVGGIPQIEDSSKLDELSQFHPPPRDRGPLTP